jgi:hypothetical protein
VKMSRLLLSAPMIFVVLVNPTQGPSLLRAILAIVNANNYNIGNGWGEYEYAPPMADRPEDETVFYNLLVGDGDSVTHWIQQLGLMLPCVRDDLQRLSKEKPGNRVHGGILEFKVTYPVIFAALEASFGLMPSNSRIAEQAHGGMRDGLIDGVSLLSTDMMRAYIMNDKYYAREMRRNCVHTRDAIAGTTKNRKGSIKHDEFKVEQVMAGAQLLASGAKYNAHKVQLLPAHVLKKINVKTLNKKGILHKDKEVEQQKKEHAAKKHARGCSGIPLTMDEFKEKAASATVGNDPL